MITIVAVGKLKEKYLEDMCRDYKKRISKYHKIEIIELKDSNIDEEGKLIKKYLNPSSYKIALAIKGKEFTTEEFKDHVEKTFISGKSNITFIIGGSDGLSEEIYKEVDEKISFSRLTYPHGLFRGILLEQIYRILKIMNNEKYHK